MHREASTVKMLKYNILQIEICCLRIEAKERYYYEKSSLLWSVKKNISFILMINNHTLYELKIGTCLCVIVSILP